MLPQISFVEIGHSPFVERDCESFIISSRGLKLVRYRAFLYTESDKYTREITNGYSKTIMQ
jgi:hypothetical protein